MNLTDTVTIITTVQDLLLYAIPVILFIIMIYQIGYLVGLKYVHSAIKRVIDYREISCPTCGYYCAGKGGVGCIDKPKLCGIDPGSNSPDSLPRK